MEKQDPILSFLVQEGALNEKSVAAVVEQQQKTGQSVISILKDGSLVSEDSLTKAVAATNKIEFINLSPEDVDTMVAHMISHDLAAQHNVIPVKKKDNQLYVAMSSPLNLSVRDEIEMKTGYKVIPVAATAAAIRQAIHYHFDVKSVTRQAIVSMRLGQDTAKVAEEEKTRRKSTRVSNAPVTKLVSSIINGAIEARASDIHIEPQVNDMKVRYRVDGLLRLAIEVPVSVQNEVISHIKIMADMDISEHRVPQDGHITVQHDNKDYDLRVSSLPGIGGEKIVMRILDKNVNRWAFDNVVTNADDAYKLRALAANPYGMILLTGPTGSGKTTTLYAMLQLLNCPEKNIVTVEDPVEYRLDGVTQLQVKPVAGLTFASALRSIVRQDPDIILVGEIRDYETAEIAVSAALTGHLVLSTLHTNDAAGAISRLINLGVAPFLVASALLGTAAQRLVRTNCPLCKKPYEPSGDELKWLSDKALDDGKSRLYKGMGCSRCYETGYIGRKSIYEILPVSTEIRRMIVQQSSDDEIKEQAVKEGMKTLYRAAADEVVRGVTTFEELLRVVDVRDD